MHKAYTGFGDKLHHAVPPWVELGARFHVRLRADFALQSLPLTESTLAVKLLDSARFYHERERWWLSLFVLMPDHLHALVSFPSDADMGRTIGDWKHWHRHQGNVIWQDNFFDHRLRDDERGEQLTQKVHYLRMNPVRAGLCKRPEDWPWVIDDSDGSCAPPRDGSAAQRLQNQ